MKRNPRERLTLALPARPVSEPVELGAIEGSGTPATVSASHALKLTVSSVIAGVAGIVLLFVVARSISADEYAQFMLYWSLLFSLFGLLTGLQHEANRAVSYTHMRPPVTASGFKPVRVIPASLMIGGVVALAIIAIGLATAVIGHTGDPGALWSTVVIIGTLAIAAILYAGQAALSGAVAGQASWGVLAGIIGADAIIRSIAVLMVVIVGGSLLGIEVASAAGVLTWLVFLAFSPQARAGARSTGDVDTRRYLRNAALTMVSAASTTILMVGFPILLRVTTPQEIYTGLGGLLLAISLTRAPIMMPLLALQSVALRFFVSTAATARKAHVLIPVMALLGVGVLGALGAYLIGPWLLSLFNPEFVVSPWTLALLTFAAAIFAILTLTGTANVSLNKHGGFVAGWVTATVIVLGVLLLPADADVRTVLALLVGPSVGIFVHLVSLWRRSSR